MSKKLIKNLARRVGMYRAARWVYHHLINRDSLWVLHEEMAFYSQFIRPNDLCFDVGANYGAKSEVFLKLGGRVIAFEPQCDCLEELQARLGTRSRLVTVPAAVGLPSGKATLYIRPYRCASSLLEKWEGPVESIISVPMITLDEAISRYGIPKYCKIDVEGFELEVLRGLSQPIQVISFEYHLRELEIQKTLDCLDHLSRFGALLLNITPAEKPIFGLPDWCSKADFIDFFLNEVPKKEGYAYGDIFVKIPP